MKSRSSSDKLKRKGSKAVRDSSEVPAPPSSTKINDDTTTATGAISKNDSKNNGGAKDSSDENSSSFVQMFYLGLRYLLGFYLMRHFLWRAFDIRMHAIREYGYIIHEFDPWFNFRATEYLYENGWKAFSTWFDYKVWYPLGRPVGTTIFPGMQITAVFLKNYVMTQFSLNDVCCLMPAIFGSLATFFTGLLAYECSHSSSERGYYSNIEVFVSTMACMALVPAHMMRSVGGGYDNESIAVTAMVLTFYCWCRSLRPGPRGHYFAFITGLAYFYMVAAWGGYVFVLNMIAMHAGILVLMGRFNDQVYKSYSIFYIVGTFLAIQVPVVGMTPLKSLEQLGALAIFGGFQLIQLSNFIIKKQRTMLREQGKPIQKNLEWKIRFLVFSGAAVFALMLGAILLPRGYFGPISSRVRGLFVKHTKTGNPLVDSVAEHQPASKSAYYTYLHFLCGLAPFGFVLLMGRVFKDDRASFLCLYGLVTYFFSSKMVRLILLTGPVASALGGVAIGRSIGWAIAQLTDAGKPFDDSEKAKKLKKNQKKGTEENSFWSRLMFLLKIDTESKQAATVKQVLSLVVFVAVWIFWTNFSEYCDYMSYQLSNPSIIYKGRTNSGKTVLVDDYREAYHWIRENTPEDARILSWWDYGYQITGISNRTTIADGNTWNHEHIALLGMILTGPEKQSHRIMRHLADYVLIWGGGGGDDLAKSPHLARIANSVYRNHCPNDPTCRSFTYIDREGTPSPMMGRSLLYKLHGHKIKPGVVADPNRFKEVFKSEFGKVRIFKILGVSKESKEWVANPVNKICDAPGSWFCRGQYPPALEPVLKSKTDFAQLEDFNKGITDDEYQRQYFENLKDPRKAMRDAKKAEKEAKQALQSGEEMDKDLLKTRIMERKGHWEDSEEATLMWNLINKNSVVDIKEWLTKDPSAAHLRSADGRGPMWWAYESKNMEIVKELMSYGVSIKEKDGKGKTPLDMLTDQEL